MPDLSQNVVTQYSNNVYAMLQQKGSKLSNCCTPYKMKGERGTIERSGATEAQLATGLYGDSPIIATPMDRRSIYGFEYVWGDMVDWKQDENTLIDPTSAVTAAGYKALGRTMDRVIIERGIFGAAFEGKDGQTEVAFPDSQKLAVTAGGDGKNCGLNLEKLIQARSLIGNADVDTDDPDEKLYFVYTQKQMDDLLRTTEVKSADYNTVKALYDGTVKHFMGFEFVRLSKQLIPLLDGGIRTCFAFAKSCVAFANPVPITSRLAERADKQFNLYAFMKMKCGATRFEDGGVVHIPCLEA